MRTLLRTLLILNILLLPIGCIPVLFVVNMVNPMATAFITDIHITNQSPEPITITPIGTIGPEGRRAPLPIYTSRLPAIPAGRRGGFQVEPGQTLPILYDWDDINLSEIVIERADGTQQQLLIDPEPTKNQYHPPTTNRFTINDLAQLDAAPPHVTAAAAQAQQPKRPWPLALLLLLPWLTFYPLFKAYRRHTPPSATATPRQAPDPPSPI